MLFNHRYPYTDFHELNLDWILCKMRELDSTLTEFTTLNKLQWCGTWDISKSYSAWSLVEDGDGNGYVSTGPVPSGIQLTNADYWQKVANYSALYSAFEQRIELLEDGEAEIKTALNAETEERKNADDSVLNSLSAFAKVDVQNLGAVIKKQFWVGDNQAYTFKYSAQGSCYDSKRKHVYIGGNGNSSNGGLLILDENFDPVSETVVSGGGNMNAMTYVEANDEVFVAPTSDGSVDVLNKIFVFDPTKWTLKRTIIPETGEDDLVIVGITSSDTHLYIQYFVTSPEFDLRCYTTDFDGKNATKIGSLYNPKYMNFNRTYPGSSTSTHFYTSDIEYFEGKIYSAQFYLEQEDSELMIPCRISVVNAENGQYIAGYDYMCAQYQELESIFKIDEELYLVSWESDWTTGEQRIITIRSITPKVNTTLACSLPVPKKYNFTMTCEHNTTKTYNITNIPSGVYLAVFNTSKVTYEANRSIQCKIYTNYDELVLNVTPPNQYLSMGFNTCFVLDKKQPIGVTIEWVPITSSTFTLNAHLTLIPLGNFTDWINTGLS
jgi:hypothetical protein